MGLFRAGFDVTGVDIEPQRNYPERIKNGNMYFVQADAMTFPLGGYDFIWASPPCQAYTLAQRIQNNDHPDLIGPIRDRLRASGAHYAIENVPGSPLIRPTVLCGSMFGLRTYRHRLIETSFPCEQLLCSHTSPTAKMGRPVQEGEFMHVVGNFSGVEDGKAAMGIGWMNRDELREAIPPDYSLFIARAFLQGAELVAAE